MPFLDNYSEDELKKKQQEQQAAAPVTQQSTVLGSGQQQTGESVGTGKGSGWTNLQTYLDNNAGQGAATTQKILDVKQDQIKGAVDSLNTEVDDTKKNITPVARNTDLENQIKTNPTAVDPTKFNEYISKSYTGPTTYTPGLDVEKKWNGLPTKSSLDEVADPYRIGEQLKKNNYTYGLGKLDSFLIQGEGGQAVEDYNTKNANVLTDRASQTQSVNSAIDTAKTDSGKNVGYAKSSVGDARTAAVGGITGRQSQVDQKNAELKKQADVMEYIINQVAKSTGKQVDPTKLFAQNSQYTLGDVTTDNDRARIKALNTLIADDTDVDLTKYNAGTPGFKLHDDVVKAGLGYKYDPVNNTLVALAPDGGQGQVLTNDPYYKKLMADAMKAKGY